MPAGADKVIDVPGVGTVSFPGDMDDKAIGDAITTHMLKTGHGMEHPTDPTQVRIEESSAPDIGRAATSVLPAAGGLAAGLIGSPSVVGTGVGAGLGYAGGREA